MLYEEGDKIVSEKKEFSCYYSRKLYRKANNIKNYIDQKLKDEMSDELEKKLKNIEKDYAYKNNDLEVYIKLIEDQIHNKNKSFISNKTGNTLIRKIINNKPFEEKDTGTGLLSSKSDYLTIIDIFQELADSFSKKGDKETEAFIYANIIKINFEILNNLDFCLYDRLNRRIQKLYEDLDEDGDFQEPDWYKALMKINENIEEKKKEYERIEEEKKRKIFLQQKEEVLNVYEGKIKENNPKEFLEYIIDNYPYNKLDPFKKEELKKENFESLLKTIYPLYQPDNYKDEIYHYIYVKLGEIDEKYLKNHQIQKSVNDN
jgi:hypothetical protein